MKLLIDNNDGQGAQDYTAYVDLEGLPQITRGLNCAATMTAALVATDSNCKRPSEGGRVIVRREDGLVLFTGYLTCAPMQQCLGQGQFPVWRYVLEAVDDSCLLDRNALTARAPFARRTAGDALGTLTNDVLPGGLDLSGVQTLDNVQQFAIVPQRTWTEHAQQLATMARASYLAEDGRLFFQPVGQASFTVSDQDPNFVQADLTVLQKDELRNDITIIGDTEPQVFVRDYFLGDGATLGFYLSHTPFSRAAATVFEEDYTSAQLDPTLWDVDDTNHRLWTAGGQLHVAGGPVTVSFVEQLELGGGLTIQHGQVVFSGGSSATIGGIYNGALSDGTCVAGFKIGSSGSNCTIQALINGSVTGPALTTTAGHQYALVTQLYCNEAHRARQTYLSSTHPSGSGRGGDPVSAAMRVVLTAHDVDPANPGTLAAPATVLFDAVLSATPAFATYALINGSSLSAAIAFTRLQRVVDAEVRSIIPGGQFHTRLTGGLADGGECYITSSGELRFYPPYPPQPNEEIVVAYRTGRRAMARVQDQNSIAQHASGRDSGRRSYVRRLKFPPAPTSQDCENAALALLDDAVQPAWIGKYRVRSEFLPVEDVMPGNAVQVAASSRGAQFSAIVREVKLQVDSLGDDRAQYEIKFANDAASSLAFEFENMILPAPVTTIYTSGTPSSSLYIGSLTAAQITNVIATEITIDAGSNPPTGGGIEVRRSDGGWGTGNSGNLAGRFATQTFTLPRLSRAQSYYLRQYDGSSPARYSRYSALLYVDYPL